MDKTKIKELLEGLDCRLALGQIDLGTYQTLKAKFSSQIEAQDGPPLEAAVSAMSVQAVALKCPGCMASLLPPPDPEQTRVKCEYCGGTFVLQTAANEVERLRGDVRKWIAEVAGQSSSGSVIDEASRQFIFRDKLWPQLKVTTDRATELYQITRYLPLFTFPLLDHLGSSPFHDALVLTPDVTNFVDRLKSIVAQIQAPELLPFTVGERDKNNLHMLEVSCMEIAHLSNVRHSLITYDTEGLCRTRANLRALGELYSAAGKNSAAFEPSYAKFTHAMANRVSAVDKAIEVLTGLLRPGEGVVTDTVIANLESTATTCESSATDIEASGREPKEVVPAAEGTRNDAQIIRMLADCVRIYAQCGAAEAAEPFAEFLTTLSSMMDKAKPARPDTVWLNVYLSNLARHVGAINGEVSVPMFSGYEWVESAALGRARKSFFGGQEKFDVTNQMLVPFWVAKIYFSEHSGTWFWKKGESAQGLVLMDASRHDGLCYIEPEESYLVGQCLEAVKSPKEIGQFAPAVIPVVSADTALRCMKKTISDSEKYRCGFVNQQGIIIIYLPAAVVRYSGKNSERQEMFLPGTNARTVSMNIHQMRLGTRELLLAN